MKKIVLKPLFLIVMVVALLGSNLIGQEKVSNKFSLDELYKNTKSKLAFISIVRLDADSLPEGVTFKFVRDIVITGRNDICVSDARTNNLMLFSSKGEFIKKIGQNGKGPGDLDFPSYMCCFDNKIIVWENGNNRYSVFSENGDFKKVFKPLKKINVKKMKIHPQGYLLIESEKIGENPDKGQLCSIDMYFKDCNFIKNIYRQEVVRGRYLADPVRLYVQMPYQPDVSWDILPDGRVIIGYQKNYELHLYNIQDGKSIIIKRPYKPVKVSQRDKQVVFDTYRVIMRNGKKKDAPRKIMEKIPFPHNHPAFSQVVTDPQGYIWVFPPQVGELENYTYFDLFAGDGRYIKRVEIVSEFGQPSKILFDNEGKVWTLSYEEDIGFVLTKYKIEIK